MSGFTARERAFPCSAAPVSVARQAIGKLQGLLRAEAGRLEGIA